MVPTDLLARTDADPYPYVKIVRDLPDGVVIEFAPPKPTIEAGQGPEYACQQVSIAGLAQSDDVALASLPVQGVMIGIPADAQPEISVIHLESERLPGTYALCPSELPVLDDLADLPDNLRDLLVFETQLLQPDAFYPTAEAEIADTGYIRSQRFLQVRLNPVQYRLGSGELRFVSKIQVAVYFNTPGGLISNSLEPISEGEFENELEGILLNYDQAVPWRSAPASPSVGLLTEAYSGDFYKISVNQDGLYALTYSYLQTAGLPVDSVNPKTFKLYDQGAEIAIRELGDGDTVFEVGESLLFYGLASGSVYGRSNVYWLTWGGSSGLRMAVQDSTPSQDYTVPVSFQTTQHLEQNLTYQSGYPSGTPADRWYWKVVLYSTTIPVEFNANLATLPEPGASTITVSGLLRGYIGTPFHRAKIYLNGTHIGTVDMPMNTEKLFTFSGISQSLLVEGANTLGVLTPLEDGLTFNSVFVNWFEITYNDAYTADADQLYFDGDQAGQWQFQVDGFSTPDLEVYDISSPLAPFQITGWQAEAVSSGYALSFEADQSGESRYVAQSTAKRLVPASIAAYTPSNLRDTSSAADYLVISYAGFLAQAQVLADYRAGQGYQTAVIDVQEIYDEFNDGELSPVAIQDFLKYAYANWAAPKPAYVLLMGDGHLDFRNNLGHNETNFIPPYLADVDPFRGERPTDNRYAMVSGTDILPDLHIGRLPVRSAEEAAAAVQKIITYETTPPADGWNGNLTFVADNTDDAGEYAADTDALIAAYLPADYTPERIYYPSTHATAAAVKSALKAAVNAGRLIVHYAGHSATQKWGDENFWALTDIGTLTNADMLPFILPMTCAEGWFVYPSPASNINTNASLGETFVRKASGGAIASWSPTGYGLQSGHMLLEANLFDNLFNNFYNQLGYLTTTAKHHLYATTAGYRDLIDTYALFGDPALRLQTIPVPLEAPTELTATTLGWESIALTWQDNADSESVYRIERSTDGVSAWEQVAELPADSTAYTDSGLTELSTWHYRVQAYREPDLMLSDYSNTASATTLEYLDPPSNLTASLITYAQIDLAWQDNSDSESGFRVERSLNGGADWVQVAELGANITAWSDADIDLETVYHYRVRAYRAADGMLSDYSNTAATTTLSTLDAPSNLKAERVSVSWVELSWQDNSLDESSFLLERSPDGLTGWEEIAQLAADVNTYTDSGLSAVTPYYYRVRAYRAFDALYSEYSNTEAITTLNGLAAPTDLLAEALSWDSIALSWQDNAVSESAYLLERSPDGINDWQQIAELPADSGAYTDTGLNPSTAYHYRVRAYRAADGLYSEYAAVDAAATLSFLNAPTDLIATAVSMDQIDLTWQDNSDSESAFLLERSADGWSAWEQIAELAAESTSYSDSPVAQASTWHYRVRAYRAADGVYSDYAGTAQATTLFQLAAPDNLVATVGCGGEVALSWQDNSLDESAFQLERAVLGSDAWELLAEMQADTNLFQDSLQFGDAYVYRVRAYRALDQVPSDYSNLALAQIPFCVFLPMVSGGMP